MKLTKLFLIDCLLPTATANFFIIAYCLLPSANCFPQELNCNIILNTENIQTTEKEIFQDMQAAFWEFMNNRRWTNDIFRPEERINCNLFFTFTDMPSISSFKATVQIQSTRPVYGTGYESILLNFVDKQWSFNYTESQPLEFNENNFTDNITSLLAYYAYIIIGLDYDSFSKLGGSDYYEKALNIVNNAQQSSAVGWRAFDGNKNRYWLNENLMNQQMQPFREGLYLYHRLAFDNMAKNPEQSRAHIISVLNKIKKVENIKPGSFLVRTFFDAKADEIVNVFTEASLQQKQQAFNLLRELDPTNVEKYEQIMRN
ncbi:MAG: DUF4835 family protein [Cytophagales bacterium]|nr:DUF4835 family protein [Cytophagales bacterium]